MLEGAGAVFSTGEDLEDIGQWPDVSRHRRPGGPHGAPPIPQQELLRRIRSLPKPTIALLRGKVLGFALDLACVCDIRICAHSTRIRDPRIAQARFAATGITHVLPRLIGQSHAMRIPLLGEPLTRKEAESTELVHRTYPPGVDFREAAREFLVALAELPTQAYATGKRHILDGLDLSFDAALANQVRV